jgi:hypothetical protein
MVGCIRGAFFSMIGSVGDNRYHNRVLVLILQRKPLPIHQSFHHLFRRLTTARRSGCAVSWGVSTGPKLERIAMLIVVNAALTRFFKIITRTSF